MGKASMTIWMAAHGGRPMLAILYQSGRNRQMSVEIVPNWAVLGKVWSKSAKVGRNQTKFGRNSANGGPICSTKSAQSRPSSAQRWFMPNYMLADSVAQVATNLGDLGPKSANFDRVGPTSAEVGQDSAKLGRSRPELARVAYVCASRTAHPFDLFSSAVAGDLPSGQVLADLYSAPGSLSVGDL